MLRQLATVTTGFCNNRTLKKETAGKLAVSKNKHENKHGTHTPKLTSFQPRINILPTQPQKEFAMTQAREKLISVADTPYYHVVSRCVRRTFLCGVDQDGTSYEHRRQWIENRIRLLSSIFAIDICAYGVMSNHYHIVVKLCPAEAENWSNDSVLKHWTSLFKGPLLVQKYLNGEELLPVERSTLDSTIAVYRNRLSSLSWFMKCLNESIAREANKEDDCTGHFWEARFKSQALLTEQALIACMTYVDLNPIRAAMAETPEQSDHTSIKERIRPSFELESAVQEQIQQHCLMRFDLPLKPLARFEGSVRNEEQLGILFDLKDYMALVDYTGRAIHPTKRGAIPEHLPPILQRLELNAADWLEHASGFEKLYERHHSRRCQARKSISG
jgi:REP element-mobilizing transposase RayT